MKPTFSDIKIGAICQVGDGAHASIKRQDQGVLYLSSRNFKDGRLDLLKVYYISEADFAKHFKDSSKAITKTQTGDVALSIIGTIGEPYVIKPSDRFGLSSAVAFLRPTKGEISSEYLYYWLRGEEFQQAVYAIKGGVAQGYVSLEMIRSLPLRKFERTYQDKLVHILSTYDDLIDNNTRRIKILEEMAQAIYREWFVNFRFPGHEQAKMVDSPLGKIPEGWEVKNMQDVAEVIDCLHSKKPKEDENGTGILLQLFNIADRGKLDTSRYYMISSDDYVKWSSRIEVREGDCVITNVGRIAAVAKIPSGLSAAIGRNMTAVRCKVGLLTPVFLIEYLLSPHMAKEVQMKKDGGAIMDSMNVRGIKKLSVPIPEKKVLGCFEKVSKPIRRKIEVLLEQNINLRQTRDLLLQKLISGKIDVFELDIATKETAV